MMVIQHNQSKSNWLFNAQSRAMQVDLLTIKNNEKAALTIYMSYQSVIKELLVLCYEWGRIKLEQNLNISHGGETIKRLQTPNPTYLEFPWPVTQTVNMNEPIVRL